MSAVNSSINTGVINQSQDRRTDEGWTASTAIAKLATTAIAVINTVAALEMSRRQYEIAKGYYDMAREMRDYWNNTFKPCEQAMVAEACAAPLYDPRYDETAGRYIASVRQQFRKKIDDVARCASRYCTGLTAAMFKDLIIAEAQAVGDAQNYAYRYEEARKEAKDDVRWARRVNALGLGRGVLQSQMAYANAAAGLFGSLGQQAAAGASGAIQALGYLNNRNDTNYPQRQMGPAYQPNPVSSMQSTNNFDAQVEVGAPMDMSSPQATEIPAYNADNGVQVLGSYAPIDSSGSTMMAGIQSDATWGIGNA